MRTRTAAGAGLCVGLLWLGGALGAGEAPPPPADAEALKTQLKQWNEKARQLYDQYREIETKIRQSPEAVKLHEAQDAAERAYSEKTKANPAVEAATRAENDANAALRKLVRETLATRAEAKALNQEREQIADRRAKLEYQEAIAQLELTHHASGVNRALDKDPELVSLREAVDEINRQNADRETRDKAFKAYEDARKAKKEALPATKTLLTEIAEVRKACEALWKDQREVDNKLGELADSTARSDDPDIKAGRDKLEAARKLVADAYASEELKAVRKARSDARNDYSAKVNELMAADKNAAALKQEIDALQKQIRDADRKLRER